LRGTCNRLHIADYHLQHITRAKWPETKERKIAVFYRLTDGEAYDHLCIKRRLEFVVNGDAL
jgi:hypothetical protein